MFKFKLPSKKKVICKIKDWTSVACLSAKRFAKATVSKTTAIIKTVSPYIEAFAKRLINNVKGLYRYRIKTVTAALVFAICLSVPVVAYASDLTSAVEVRYNGNSYGFVAEMSDAEAVKEIVRTSIYGKFDIDGFSFDKTTVTEDRISAADIISMAVIDGVDGVKPACGLYVDGVLKAISTTFAEMNTVLSNGISHFTASGAKFVGFANSVVLRDIYVTDAYAARLAVSAEKLINGKYGVQFETTSVEEFEQEIVFSETIKYNKNKKTSYEKVTQKGKNGVMSVTANVTYINGEMVGFQEISSTVVTEPIEQITVKGTKKTPVYYSGYVLATKIMIGTAEMIFPVECNGSTYITSFWGDGRGHKGLDIAAPQNTNIYTAANGTVTYAGYRSDYGYMIIIDHDDGKTQTVYSHNSKNLVKKGDKVTAGQHIAEVGATGNATGNHLHFEVRINGTPVDAAPYVGLR